MRYIHRSLAQSLLLVGCLLVTDLQAYHFDEYLDRILLKAPLSPDEFEYFRADFSLTAESPELEVLADCYLAHLIEKYSHATPLERYRDLSSVFAKIPHLSLFEISFVNKAVRHYGQFCASYYFFSPFSPVVNWAVSHSFLKMAARSGVKAAEYNLKLREAARLCLSSEMESISFHSNKILIGGHEISIRQQYYGKSNVVVYTTDFPRKIDSGDFDCLGAMLTYYFSKNSYSNWPVIVDVNSGGGNGDEAVKIARLLSQLHLPVYVRKDAKCQSACFFLLMASPDRHGEGDIGVHHHRFDFQEFSKLPDDKAREIDIDADQKFQELYDDFKVDPWLIEKSKLTPSTEMFHLREEDGQIKHGASQIVGVSSYIEPWLRKVCRQPDPAEKINEDCKKRAFMSKRIQYVREVLMPVGLWNDQLAIVQRMK